MKLHFYLHRLGAGLFLRVLQRHYRIEHTNTKAKAQCKYNFNLNVYVNGNMNFLGDNIQAEDLIINSIVSSNVFEAGSTNISVNSNNK